MRISKAPWNGARDVSSSDRGPIATQPALSTSSAGTDAAYQIIERHYPAFRDVMAMQGKPLPPHVQQEFADYLKCGRLEHGFLRVQCSECTMNTWSRSVGRSSAPTALVNPFTSPQRGFCPSCGARRMAEITALLVDEVFPEQPILQWVLSFPFQLRFLFASRPEVMGRGLGIGCRAISSHLIQKAGFTRKTAQTGAVILIQRFGSALNLNDHFHMKKGAFPPPPELLPATRPHPIQTGLPSYGFHTSLNGTATER